MEAVEMDLAEVLKNQTGLVDWLKYCSYRANRSLGMTQAQLVSLGFDPRFETMWTAECVRAA